MEYEEFQEVERHESWEAAYKVCQNEHPYHRGIKDSLDALRIYGKKAEVNPHNYDKMRDLKVPVIQVHAKHEGEGAKDEVSMRVATSTKLFLSVLVHESC